MAVGAGVAALLVAGCGHGNGEVARQTALAPEVTLAPVELNVAVLPPTPAPTVEEPPAPSTTLSPATVPATIVKVFTSTVGPWLAYGEWAIPAYIVECESEGDWYAHNASGASGPYQLMPIHFNGALAMNQSRAAQHAKAAELWDGGRGESHWVECL